jgi:hypothetical protein
MSLPTKVKSVQKLYNTEHGMPAPCAGEPHVHANVSIHNNVETASAHASGSEQTGLQGHCACSKLSTVVLGYTLRS